MAFGRGRYINWLFSKTCPPEFSGGPVAGTGDAFGDAYDELPRSKSPVATVTEVQRVDPIMKLKYEYCRRTLTASEPGCHFRCSPE